MLCVVLKLIQIKIYIYIKSKGSCTADIKRLVYVLPIRIVKSNVLSIGPLSERNRKNTSLWWRANYARNIRLYYLYRFMTIYIDAWKKWNLLSCFQQDTYILVRFAHSLDTCILLKTWNKCHISALVILYIYNCYKIPLSTQPKVVAHGCI